MKKILNKIYNNLMLTYYQDDLARFCEIEYKKGDRTYAYNKIMKDYTL